MSDDGTRELQELLDGTVGPDDPAVTGLLGSGDVEVHGRMPWSSNGTFLVSVSDGDRRAQAIYKPESGERPLWDFPPGLWRREVATWRLARLLGWDVVPPTVERDGPLGVGSMQLFVPARFEEHYFTIVGIEGHRRELEQICVLDLLANNTDRKGGHVLVGLDGRLWGIDHGLNFHVEPKLRTVLWGWKGDPLSAAEVADVARVRSALDGDLGARLRELLAPREVDATRRRVDALLAAGCFPEPDPWRHVIPWPPF